MRTKSHHKHTINVITLGCSKNLYDSEVLMGQLKASGKEVVHEKEGNIVVVNTCGFIADAKEESVNTILEQIQKKEKGEVDRVYVTGCLSERYKPDLEKEIPQVDQYFGTTDLPQLLKVLGADYKHELLGERLTTTPEITHISKSLKAVIDLVLFVRFHLCEASINPKVLKLW